MTCPAHAIARVLLQAAMRQQSTPMGASDRSDELGAAVAAEHERLGSKQKPAADDGGPVSAIGPTAWGNSEANREVEATESCAGGGRSP